MLSGETVPPTRIIFQYMKALTKIEKIRTIIAPKMTDLINFLDKNNKSAAYTGGDIHVIYRYLDMIGAPTTLTTSGHRSHHFGPSSSSNNDTATLQPVNSDLRMRQKSIFEFCGRIGHKSDACIISGPKLLPTSLRRKINKFNALHGDEPKEPPIEWNSQAPSDHFKYRSSPPITNPAI